MRIEARDAAIGVHDDEAPADVDRRGLLDVPVRHQCELGRPAADVDVEDVAVLVVRELGGPGAVGGEHRLHVMAGGGADELAADFREQLADRLRVLAAQCLAGEDHGAGVDGVWVQASGDVGVLDDGADRLLVDAHLVEVRGQRHRRLVERLAVHDEVAARKVLAEPAHVQPGKDHLGAGRADVDADARQRDVVGLPEGVLFNGPRRTGVMIMIVVVIGLVLVGVLEIAAVRVVGERVRGFRRRRLAHSTRARVRDAT